jgi:hypothetical protein
MGGNNQLDQSQSNLSGLQDQLLGPDYNYSAQIKAPQQMGMSGAGSFSVLENDITGLMNYVRVLITGRGNASRTGEPLGTKFFLPTAVKCKDKATDKEVTRSLYINNVPDGSLPFISQGMGGVSFPEFKGLVPGLMSNLAQINPLQILQAFTTGASPTCQAITMETINSNNVRGSDTGYVTNTDIDLMPNTWFTMGGKPDTTEKESFDTMQSESSLINEKGTPVNYSKMPDDFFIKLYYGSLGLLGFYIFLKMMLRKRLIK